MNLNLEDINSKVAEHLIETAKTDERLSLYPPATDLAIHIDSLFQTDPSVYTIWNARTNTLRMYVKGAAKADAVNYLVGHKERDVKINVTVFCVREDGETEELPTPSYDITPQGISDHLKAALNGIGFGYQFNDVYIPITKTTYHFLEIEAKPVAIPNDNFGNPYGFTVKLAGDLLKEVLETGGLMVSTYVRKSSGEISE